MSARTFDIQVNGYTKGGYAVTLTTQDVDDDKMPAALAWLEERLSVLEVQPRRSETVNGVKDNPGWPDTKLCPIHKVEMQRHEKGNSHWWSHKVTLEDGTEHWCRGK